MTNTQIETMVEQMLIDAGIDIKAATGPVTIPVPEVERVELIPVGAPGPDFPEGEDTVVDPGELEAELEAVLALTVPEDEVEAPVYTEVEPDGTVVGTYADGTVERIATEAPKPERLDRNTAIKRIRRALKIRTGRTWSVTGGRGTAWGWIKISAPPKRRIYNFEGGTDGHTGYMGIEDRVLLAAILGVNQSAKNHGETPMVHPQGESVPASSGHYREYVDRAEGNEITEYGVTYWD